MNKRVIAFLIILLCCVCGCERNDKNAANEQLNADSYSTNDISTDDSFVVSNTNSKLRDSVHEEDSNEASIDEISKTEDILVKKTQTATLDFVDVFGVHYETTIKPDVPKHNYVNNSFIRDGNRLFYEDDNYYSRFGIDVSRHQGKINWKKVKEQGITFAFLRIGYRAYGTEGKIHLDQKFYENIKGAQDVGIDVGVYFFSQAISEEEASEEAKFVIDALDGYSLQLPVVYDPESILDDVARTDNVSGEQFTKNTIAFCDSVRENGYEPMIYSNMLWEAFEFDLSLLQTIPIWYAGYEEFPQTPYHFVFWQYTNEGSIGGIDGNVDLDIQIIKK